MQTAEAKVQALLARRGTKRTCQDDECGERYYDLNRTPIACPYCGEAYVAPPPVALQPDYRRRAVYKLEKPAPIAVEDPVDEETADDDAVEAVSADDDAAEKTDGILDLDVDGVLEDEIEGAATKTVDDV